jgi:hypothetical protein
LSAILIFFFFSVLFVLDLGYLLRAEARFKSINDFKIQDRRESENLPPGAVDYTLVLEKQENTKKKKKNATNKNTLNKKTKTHHLNRFTFLMDQNFQTLSI